jgi:ABC-2 type transport system permease protein
LDWKHIQAVSKSVEVSTTKITKKGEEKGVDFLETFFTSYVFIILLMFLILTTGQLLIRSLIEEKSNRIIEVLISSCSPTELMAGKILGLSALGFTQIVLWGLMGVVGVVASGTHFIAVESFLLILVYFVLGYVFYAAIFVGVGSLATTEQEAQQLTSYVSMILVLPVALSFVAMMNPDSTLIKVLSYIPLLTPAFMTMQLAIQMPPLWEILITIALLGGSTFLAVWIAGKVFRVGILVYGKRPDMKEILRWIRS